MSTPRSASSASRSSEIGRGDEGLAGEVLEAEADELVVGRDDDVAVAGGLAGQRGAEPGARAPATSRLHRAGQLVQRPRGRRRGEPEQRVGVEPGRQVEPQQRVGELDVVGELPQHPRGPGVVEAAEHHGARVGEVAGHLGLHVPDRPLLQHVAQGVAVGDRDGVGAPPSPARRRSRSPSYRPTARASRDAGDRDGGRLRPPRSLTSRSAASTSPPMPDPQDPEAPVEEGDLLVVVALRAGQADVDDEGEVVGASAALRPSPSSRSRGGRS